MKGKGSGADLSLTATGDRRPATGDRSLAATAGIGIVKVDVTDLAPDVAEITGVFAPDLADGLPYATLDRRTSS